MPVPPASEDHAGRGDRELVVDLALLAPSVHNTQPWRWTSSPAGWELHVDHTRSLTVADVSGRERTISCGAALHHAEVAAAGLGLPCRVERWPDGSVPDLLARIRWEAGVGVADPGLVEAIHRRRTDRRRFTDEPVDGTTLADLCAATRPSGAYAVPVVGLVERLIVEQMVTLARVVQSHDPRAVLEHRRWTSSAQDGISPDLVPPAGSLPLHRRPRFESGALADGPQGLATAAYDSLLILATRDDAPPSWLAAGEALSAIWLRAVHHGVSLVPLSQVTEVHHTRNVLHRRILAGHLVPQLLLRLGRHDPAREALPARRLRPRTDVVDPGTSPDGPRSGAPTGRHQGPRSRGEAPDVAAARTVPMATMGRDLRL